MDNLDKIVKALEELPKKYDDCKPEDNQKQNGYVEGVCDAINLVVKLYYTRC